MRHIQGSAKTVVLVILAALGVLLSAAYLLFFVPLTPHDLTVSGHTTQTDGVFDYTLPLDSESPWPKFRANALQNGRTPILPKENTGLAPWRFQTGKGIFSSPVVDKDGTVYIGSADNHFYAINLDGTLKWKFQTGDIIDSSALLTNDGNLYFGSGDSNVYALDKQTGVKLWTFKGQTPAEVESEYNIETYNLGWFEGNIGLLPDGSLLAPNDNYLVYNLNARTGEKNTAFLANEMVWTSPAVNPDTGRLFFGTCAQVLQNMYCYSFDGTAKRQWLRGGLGSVSSSPLLTSAKENGAAIMGCFDGYVRALSQQNGKTLWKTALGDHIYASAAALSDGTIIIPAADGTLYALHPETGDIVWAFDTFEPIRSSPVVDGEDNIYVGSGQGRLFCVTKEGRLKWSYQLIHEARNDLNASPALGFDGVYIAGESGEVFFMPYDYPLSEAGRADPNTNVDGEELPRDGAYLFHLSPFGAYQPEVPDTLAANEPLSLGLFVREKGDTVPSLLDGAPQVTVSPDTAVRVDVSASGRFIILTPQERWGNDGDTVTITLKAPYKTEPARFGLKAFAGRDATPIEKTVTFTIAKPEGASNPFTLAQHGQGEASVIELSRLSVPNPVMLPSYNQIGFDSLHYLAGAVAPAGDDTLLWVVGGKLSADGTTTYDPSLQVRFPLLLHYENGLVTLRNYDGFKINFFGSWDMPFGRYRVSSQLLKDGTFAPGTLVASMNCDEIEYYGFGLKLMGMSDAKTGVLNAIGGMNLQSYPAATRPDGVGDIAITRDKKSVTAAFSSTTLLSAAHVYSVLLVAEDGTPLPLYYTRNTTVTATPDGLLESIVITSDSALPDTVTAYVLADNYPIHSQLLTK